MASVGTVDARAGRRVQSGRRCREGFGATQPAPSQRLWQLPQTFARLQQQRAESILLRQQGLQTVISRTCSVRPLPDEGQGSLLSRLGLWRRPACHLCHPAGQGFTRGGPAGLPWRCTRTREEAACKPSRPAPGEDLPTWQQKGGAAVPSDEVPGSAPWNSRHRTCGPTSTCRRERWPPSGYHRPLLANPSPRFGMPAGRVAWALFRG